MNKEIMEKANKCLKCNTKPCSNKGCPLNNNIPEFIKKIKEDNIEEAYDILLNTTALQSICGRICPHKKQCEGSCVKGINGTPVNIGDLEAFVGDYAIDNHLKIKMKKDKDLMGKKVAVIGGGPAGLTCSAFLAQKGIKVTIYERYDFLGGLLLYGIPDFRLSKDIVQNSINKILDLGINVKFNQKLGENLSLNDLLNNYDRVFIAVGANNSVKTGIQGEDLDGVYGGNELLEHANHPNYNGKTVFINGGGNVAMDIARTIKRKNAKKVYIVYRRGKKQMPAEEKEIKACEDEGIIFLYQNNIVKIKGGKKVESIELIKTELIQKKGDTRLSPVNIENSNYDMKADYVVMAIGSTTDKNIQKLGLKLTNDNNIKVDENNRTSNEKIYAGGDAIGGMKTVAWAARDGRNVAENIIEDFRNIHNN